MKTDLYTKVILTIIAIALTINLFKASITPAVANNTRYATIPVNADGTINVTIKKMPATVDVNIQDINSFAFQWVEPLKVKIKQ